MKSKLKLERHIQTFEDCCFEFGFPKVPRNKTQAKSLEDLIFKLKEFNLNSEQKDYVKTLQACLT